MVDMMREMSYDVLTSYDAGQANRKIYWVHLIFVETRYIASLHVFRIEGNPHAYI